MNLLPSVGSDKAWVYSVNADFADEEPKVEQLAIRFKNAESEFRCNLLPVSFAKYSTSKKKTLKFKAPLLLYLQHAAGYNCATLPL